jgi:hypothetical protein
VFWGGGIERSHFVVFPFFWRFRDNAAGRTTTVVGNYLHRTWGGETTDVFFPLFHYRRGARPGGQDETSFTLFPFAHYRRDSRSTVFASPLAAWIRRPGLQAGFVLPYFWYRSDTVQVRGVPLLYLDHTFQSTGQRTRMFGPYVMVDGPDVTARVLFPFYARYREQGTDRHLCLSPLLRSPRRQRLSDGQRPSLLLVKPRPGPPHPHGRALVPHQERRTAQPRIGPRPAVCLGGQSPAPLLVTPLFVYHRNHETQTSRVVAPLYFQSSRPDASTHVVFPLWWQGRQGSKSHIAFFPLYWRFADSDEQSTFNLAGPLLWSSHGSESTRGLLPLFWYARDRANQTGSEAAAAPVLREALAGIPDFRHRAVRLRQGARQTVVVRAPLRLARQSEEPFLHFLPALVLVSRQGQRNHHQGDPAAHPLRPFQSPALVFDLAVALLASQRRHLVHHPGLAALSTICTRTGRAG